MSILYYYIVDNIRIVFTCIYSITCRDTGNRYSLTGTHAVRRLRKHNTIITSYNMRYAIMYIYRPYYTHIHIYIIYNIL